MVADWFNIFGWLLSVVTVVGNGFVVFLVAKNRQLHSTANWFVLSLAVADFMVGFAVFPTQYLCKKCNFKVSVAFFWFFLHSSVSNLCTLTWDRYIAIVHPFKYTNSITARRPGMVIIVAWLIPFAIALSLLVGMYATDSDTAWKVLRLAGVSAFDIISCVLLLYAVVRILVLARAQSHEASAIQLQVQSSQTTTETGILRRRKKHNAARFIVAIVVFFLGCYAVVNYLVLCIILSCQVSDKAGQILNVLLVSNSTANPLVYAFLKKDIKKQIKKLFCRRNKRGGDRGEVVP